MRLSREKNVRIVPAVHSKQEVEPELPFEIDLPRHLGGRYPPNAWLEQYSRFAIGDVELDSLKDCCNQLFLLAVLVITRMTEPF